MSIKTIKVEGKEYKYDKDKLEDLVDGIDQGIVGQMASDFSVIASTSKPLETVKEWFNDPNGGMQQGINLIREAFPD